MALSKLPCRPTPICVQCVSGIHVYVRGGFILRVSCVPGLRDLDDILAIYTRVPTDTPMGRMHSTVYPEISGIVSAVGNANLGAGTMPWSNQIRIVAYHSGSYARVGQRIGALQSCLNECSAGADLHGVIFCVTVRGR